MLTTRRIRHTTVVCAIACGLVAPAASADPPPHLIPDPVATPSVAPLQDLRSPDTRDAALGRGPSDAPDVTVIKVREPVAVAERGLDWGDAVLGAGTVLVAILAGLGGALAIVHRRRRSVPTATAV